MEFASNYFFVDVNTETEEIYQGDPPSSSLIHYFMLISLFMKLTTHSQMKLKMELPHVQKHKPRSGWRRSRKAIVISAKTLHKSCCLWLILSSMTIRKCWKKMIEERKKRRKEEKTIEEGTGWRWCVHLSYFFSVVQQHEKEHLALNLVSSQGSSRNKSTFESLSFLPFLPDV